ncbi:hypothetical protein [Spongiactinospora sp. 9N601]
MACSPGVAVHTSDRSSTDVPQVCTSAGQPNSAAMASASRVCGEVIGDPV